MKAEFLDVDIDPRNPMPQEGEGMPIPARVGRGRPRKGPKGKPRGTTASNKWLQLVKKVKSENPELSYKQALQAAKHIKDEHGYDQALGAGFSLKGLVRGIGKAAKSVGKLVKKAAPHVKKALEKAAPVVGRYAESALHHAEPHIIKAGEEALERGISKVTGMPHENKPFSKIALEGAVDVGRKVAQEGVKEAAKELGTKAPKLSPAIHGLEKTIHGAIEHMEKRRKEGPPDESEYGERSFHELFGEGAGMAGGEVEKYVNACCKHCAKHEPSGGFAAAAAIPFITALAPTVVPAAVGLFEKLLGLGVQQKGEGFIPFLIGALTQMGRGEGFRANKIHEMMRGRGKGCMPTPMRREQIQHTANKLETGKGTPGDYSFNELGVREGQGGGFLANLLGIPQIINAARGRGGNINNNYGDHSIHKSLMGGIQQGGNNLETQKSDPPIDNVWATHAQLWWFTPQPGLMGRTELPANQYFLNGRDVNLDIEEQAQDIAEYVNSAPTYEDGVTQIAPSALSYSKSAVSGMPQDSSVSSTLADIKGESQGPGPHAGKWARTEHGEGKWDHKRNTEGSGGFVYAPGMSIEKLASAQHRYGMGASNCNTKLGTGGAFSIPHGRGGDVNRIGRGIIPPESTITGTPIGVSQRGRGTLIKSANVATWG